MCVPSRGHDPRKPQDVPRPSASLGWKPSWPAFQQLSGMAKGLDQNKKTYPLVICYSLLLKIPHWNSWFTISKMVMFHSFFVCLPGRVWHVHLYFDADLLDRSINQPILGPALLSPARSTPARSQPGRILWLPLVLCKSYVIQMDSDSGTLPGIK